MTKAAIIGSRGFTDYEAVKNFLEGRNLTQIISGGARGADFLAKKYALENKIDYLEFPAQWDKFGKSAGYKRNIDIIDACEVCIAFWDGKSKGTEHSLNLAREKNKLTIVYKELK